MDFDRDCAECLNQFGKYCHLENNNVYGFLSMNIGCLSNYVEPFQFPSTVCSSLHNAHFDYFCYIYFWLFFIFDATVIEIIFAISFWLLFSLYKNTEIQLIFLLIFNVLLNLFLHVLFWCILTGIFFNFLFIIQRASQVALVVRSYLPMLET